MRDIKTFECWLVITLILETLMIEYFHELAVLFSFLWFYLTRCEFYLKRFLMRRHCRQLMEFILGTSCLFALSVFPVIKSGILKFDIQAAFVKIVVWAAG